MKNLLVTMAFIGLVGCTLTPQPTPNSEETPESSPVDSVNTCLFVDRVQLSDERCAAEFWFHYWAQTEQLPWPKRLSLIEGMEDHPIELLQKVILSQPVNTPYKARLRAQHWFAELSEYLTPEYQHQLNVIIVKPSEQMLEFESAISLLSKVNNSKDKTIERQDAQIKKLRAQLEALLNIESNLMHQEEDPQP